MRDIQRKTERREETDGEEKGRGETEVTKEHNQWKSARYAKFGT